MFKLLFCPSQQNKMQWKTHLEKKKEVNFRSLPKPVPAKRSRLKVKTSLLSLNFAQHNRESYNRCNIPILVQAFFKDKLPSSSFYQSLGFSSIWDKYVLL